VTAPVLFLYGSLREGQPAHAERDVARRSRHVGTDRVAGRLLDMGAWPALVPGCGGRVAGELRLVLDHSLLADLDVFERALPGCDGGQIFERRSLRTIGGYEVQVYAWLGRGDVAPSVSHGDWIRHLQDMGKRR
jgi:gamma-glutamylcyclotransferase (GGCT)/AIG2-like uncharacterized protein YtfP